MSSLGLEQIPAPADTSVPSSTLDRIREQYRRAAEKQTLDLGVPNSDLGVRYKAVDPDDLPILEEDEKSARHPDFLIAACDCILIRDEHGEWEPLTADGLPVQFDQQLAELMGWHTATSREVVLKVFSTVPSPKVGIVRHVLKLNEWMSGGQESLLGES